MTTPAQQFTDRIWTVPPSRLELSDASNGDWKFQVGSWAGRVDGRGYVVQVMMWRNVLVLVFVHGHQFRRRWEQRNVTRAAVSRRARQLVIDVLAGRIGTVGKGAA